ncbi:Terminase [Fusobacterium sp. oral taxon C10]
MNKAPKIYADWIKVFNTLKSGENDETILPLMQEGEIVWQSGVAERFLRKLVDTVNFRLNKAIDNFQKSRQSDENEIVQSLMQLRRELQFMLKVVDINVIPVKEKMELRNMIINQSNSIQESLEKSSESDRSGKLSSIIKNNKVTVQ